MTFPIEREMSDGRVTLRATVDVVEEDGQLYSTLALEPNEGELHQIVIRMTPDLWMHLVTIGLNVHTDLTNKRGPR